MFITVDEPYGKHEIATAQCAVVGWVSALRADKQ